MLFSKKSNLSARLQSRLRTVVKPLTFLQKNYLNKDISVLLASVIALVFLFAGGAGVLQAPFALGDEDSAQSATQENTDATRREEIQQRLNDRFGGTSDESEESSTSNSTQDVEIRSDDAGSTSVKVNGEQIPLPDNGRTRQAVPSNDNQVIVDVVIENDGSSDNGNSSTVIDISSNSHSSSDDSSGGLEGRHRAR